MPKTTQPPTRLLATCGNFIRDCSRPTLISLLCLGFGFALAGDLSESHASGQPTRLYRSHQLADDRRAEEWLIQVPENRRDPSSRLITVHYLRFPASTPSRSTPVFILPGGPGSVKLIADLRRDAENDSGGLMAEIKAYSRSRDVIVVNQRGVSRTPAGPALPASWIANAASWRSPFVRDDYAASLSRDFESAIGNVKRLGFDLRGYDILHLVDDVDAIRKSHDYDRIALRGASFGSQWALAYHRRYPERVDRMLLMGVEPIDFAYDSADGIWNVLSRIEQQARQANRLELPQAGLLEAVKSIIRRLETDPVQVRGTHPRKNLSATVMIGADDFRQYLYAPILDSQPHSRQMFRWWPKFIHELYHGDYRYLASKIIDDRPEPKRFGMLSMLVDHSLGISRIREQQLAKETSRRWLGDVNWAYTATRSVCPTPVIDDTLRTLESSDTPLLMVHGTLDLATPIENTVVLERSFPNAKRITVDGGTHAAAIHAARADPQFLSYLVAFLESSGPRFSFDQIPDRISLPRLDFELTDGDSLFELLVK